MLRGDPDTAPAPVVGAAERWPVGGLPLHSHRRHQLMYAVQGVMHVSTDSGHWMLPTSRAIWINAGTAHAFVAKRPLELRVLYIDPDAVGLLPWADCAVLNVDGLVRELIAAATELPWNYISPSRDSRLAQVLLDHLIDMQRAPVNLPEPKDVRLKRIAAALRQDLTDASTLDDFAILSAASPRTIVRLFQQETGMSFGEWRTRLRLLHALELLAEGAPVGVIADEVGYGSSSSFIAAFRSLFGCTPGTYFR